MATKHTSSLILSRVDGREGNRFLADQSLPLEAERLSVADVLNITRLGQPEASRMLWSHLATHVRRLTDLLLDRTHAGQPAINDALLADALDHAADYAGNLPVSVWLPEAIGEQALLIWGRQDEDRQRLAIAAMLPRFDSHGRRTGPPAPSTMACRESAAGDYRAAFDLLPPLYRMTLVLADVCLVPRAHLAEMLSRDESATNLLLHQARLAVTEFILATEAHA